MPEDVKELNGKNFDAFAEKGNVVVDFWAEWCGPCKILKPIFEEVASEMKGKAKFCKVDIEEGQEIAERLGVMSVPTVIFLKDGEQVERFSGIIEKKKFIGMIKSVF
jgi:thioredoxin 1